MSFCTKCGSPVIESDRFCAQCGNENPHKHDRKVATDKVIFDPVAVNRTIGKHWLYIAITLIALFFTNPSEIDFYTFARGEVMKKYQSVDDGSAPAVSNFIVGLISNALMETTARDNYYIFSKYTVDLRGLQLIKGDLPSHITYVGIFGQFIPTHKD